MRTVASLRRRSIESRPQLAKARNPHAAAAVELADWLSWLELGGASPITVYTYGWTVDRLLAAFPDKRFDEFTDSELLYVMKQTTPRSRLRFAAVFRSWFRWGMKTRRLTHNPADFLPDFKRIGQPVINVFTVEEEAALRALPEPNGTLLALLFDTGIRKAEACNLTVKRVDFEEERLIVIEGAKGSKQRTVPIDNDSTPRLLARLDQMFTLEGLGPDDYLWATRPGGGRIRHDKPITGPSFHGWWVDRIAEANVKYRKPHTTRHTYATRWRQRGLDLGDIQLLLGHANVGTTQAIYVHEDTEDSRRRMIAIRALEETQS